MSGRHDTESPYWWLALGRVPGVGSTIYLRLLDRFGSPRAVFQAPARELKQIERMGSNTVRAILEFDDASAVERDLERMERMGVRLTTIGRAPYPPSLAAIPDPPPYLYVRGELRESDRLAVAVVGARAGTQYGLNVTFRIARELAARGITVVSGMARGIDSQAHRGALAGGGRTVAVLGSGINVIYPPENRDLCRQIAEHGAVVTEYPLDAQPDAGHFPTRNRIISGMSLGVTIVEAAPKSGSLITAKLALEQGREVFAVPGSVDALRSRGAHDLIRQGAHLVESAEDILRELSAILQAWGKDVSSQETGAEGDVSLTPHEERIIALIDETAVHIDAVIEKSGLGPAITTATLLELELKGLVRQTAGKQFHRVYAKKHY